MNLTEAKEYPKNRYVYFKERRQWRAFREQNRLPPSIVWTGSSLGPQDFQVIFEVVRSQSGLENLKVAELGSGLSTIVLASVLSRAAKELQIDSIEGNKHCAHRTQQMLYEYELDRYVNVNHVPYKQSGRHIWFDMHLIEQILTKKSVNLLIVDAPERSLCTMTRARAIPFFLQYLSRDSVVFLHDALRPDESQICEEWGQYFNTYFKTKTPRGLAVFSGIKTASTTPRTSQAG